MTGRNYRMVTKMTGLTFAGYTAGVQKYGHNPGKMRAQGVM